MEDLRPQAGQLQHLIEGDLLQPNAFRLLNDAFLICQNSFSWDSFFFSLSLSW